MILYPILTVTNYLSSMYLICKKGGKTVSTYYTWNEPLGNFLSKIVHKRNFFGGGGAARDWLAATKVFDFESHFSFDDVS